MSGEDVEIESSLQPAAVVCADVERYSSLVDQHESLLKFDHLMGNLGRSIRDDLRATLGEDAAKRYVVKPAGDGVLLVYPGDIRKGWSTPGRFTTISTRGPAAIGKEDTACGPSRRVSPCTTAT